MAKIPFLTSKLAVPPLNRRHIARPRLVETLDTYLMQGSRLVVVSAPAGYGKTTLLSEWVHTSQYIHSQNIRIRWISLEKEEVDLQHFALLIMAALIADPQKLGVFLTQFDQAPGQQDWLQILSDAVELVKEDHLVLILDDYTWTSDEYLQAFLQGLPPFFQVMISSRIRPAGWIVRYRLEWLVAELTQADLRFQDHETLAFLENETKRKINLKTAEMFVRRTEGWAVALQLVIWRIQLGVDPQQVVKDLRGDEDLLLDYLIGEVYQKQSPENRCFLRRTSILRRLNPQICDAIREKNDSALILRELQQANVFLSAVDENHHWYRYHNLFEDFLRKRLLEEDGPEVEKRLNLLASDWYSHQINATREAAEHAMNAGDFELVVKLMETGTYDDILPTSYPLAINLLLQVPVKEYINSPWLSIMITWAITLLGSTIDGKTNKEWLDIAKAGLAKKIKDAPADSRLFQHLNSEIEILAAFVNSSALSDPLEGRKEKMANHFLIEMIYRVHQCTRSKILGDYRSAFRILQEGFLSSRLKGNPFFTQYFKSVLIFDNINYGRLHEAEKLLTEPEDWLDSSVSLFSLKALVQISQGSLALQRDQMETAWLYIGQVSENHSTLGQYEKYILSIFMVHYYLAIKDWQNAHRVITQVQLLARDFSSPHYQAHANALNGLLDLRQGFLERVKLYLDIPLEGEIAQNVELQQKVLLLSCRYQLAMARKNPAAGRVEVQKCIESLVQAIEKVDREYNPLLWVEMQIVKALLYQELGNLTEASEEISAAVHLGALYDYRRLFLDEGSEVKELLLCLAKKKIEINYCKKLIKSMAQGASPSDLEQPQEADQQVVTRREREILFYLAKGESNTEIAARLFVTLSTVKKHLANLYHKLGVDSRRQAVKVATQKGWIKEIHLKE